MTLVLDSWPILEWFYNRSPADKLFESLLESTYRENIRLCMSRMNLGEVYYSAIKEYKDVSTGSTLLRQLDRLPIEVVSVSDEHVDVAARLKSIYKISYADGFAAALAVERNAPVATGDRDFRLLAADGILVVHWMGA